MSVMWSDDRGLSSPEYELTLQYAKKGRQALVMFSEIEASLLGLADSHPRILSESLTVTALPSRLMLG